MSDNDARAAGTITIWTKIDVVAKVALAVIGLVATTFYRLHQERLDRIKTVETMISHLTADKPTEARVAAMAVNEIINRRFMLQLVAALPEETAGEIASVLGRKALTDALAAPNLTLRVKRTISLALDRSESLALNLSQVPEAHVLLAVENLKAETTRARSAGREYWCYVGSWDPKERTWLTSNFVVPVSPDRLPGSDIKSIAYGYCASDPSIARQRGTWGEELEILRSRAEQGILYIAVGSTVRVLDVQEWSQPHATRNSVKLYWARVKIVASPTPKRRVVSGPVLTLPVE